MELVSSFTHMFLHYLSELWWILAIGFFLSGVFYEFVPTKSVEKHLGESGMKPILIASVVGVLLPVCCIGSLPIALTLRRKGASLGSVLAFLVATPATSISALIVSWKLLGGVFTIVIFFAVILMGIVMGIVMAGIKVDLPIEKEKKGESCCSEESGDSKPALEASLSGRLKGTFRYALIKLPKEMGREILIGIAIASFITVFDPIQHFIQHYLMGLLGYFVVLIFGLLTYVCSTASVPMADALMQSGLSSGQALCYLLAGPVTSYATIMVIKKDFGSHILGMYLGIIAIFALFSGMVFDLLMPL